MASIISAGTTSGTALNMAGDTSGVLQLATNGSTTALTINTSQNVGIGTTSPTTTLTVAHSNGGAVDVRGVSSDGARIRFYNNAATSSQFQIGQGFASGSDNVGYLYNFANAALVFGTNNTERMRIDASGIVLINQTSTSAANAGTKFQAATDILSTGGLAGFFFENRNGGVTASTNWYGWYSTGTIFMYNGASNISSINASTGVYTALSDINKKKDFEPSLLGLNEILKLKPTLYRMKDASNDSPKELGLIAQEVKEIIPQAYFENTSLDAVGKESTFIGLNDRAIVTTLVKAVQEQQTIINDLKARITALEGAA
jgi:hypothetical protein